MWPFLMLEVNLPFFPRSIYLSSKQETEIKDDGSSMMLQNSRGWFRFVMYWFTSWAAATLHSSFSNEIICLIDLIKAFVLLLHSDSRWFRLHDKCTEKSSFTGRELPLCITCLRKPGNLLFTSMSVQTHKICREDF